MAKVSESSSFIEPVVNMKRPTARHVLKKPARHVLKKPACDELKKPASALTTAKGGVCNPNYICFLSEKTPTCLSRAGFISRLKAFVGTTVPRQQVEIGLSRREKNADQSSVPSSRWEETSTSGKVSKFSEDKVGSE